MFGLSSASVMSSMWASAQSSFTDLLGEFSRMKSLTLSLKLTSEGHHGGLAFGCIHSVSSNVQLLTWVMHVVGLHFGFVLCLLFSLYGGSGGRVVGVMWSCCSGYMWDMMG